MTDDTVRRSVAEHVDVAERVAAEMAGQIRKYADRIVDTLRSGGRLLFCGNGGSAADAQHLAAEFVVRAGPDRRALPAVALTTDSSVLTAGGNDLGFERIFEQQVRALGRPGDLLVVHSSSGESENLLRAVAAARDVGMRSVALLARDGGRLGRQVDLALIVPTGSTARAQEMHITIGHIVFEIVDRELEGARAARPDRAEVGSEAAGG